MFLQIKSHDTVIHELDVDEHAFDYVTDSNGINEKKAELFKEHTNYAKHHKKWLELSEHYYGILSSHGFKC